MSKQSKISLRVIAIFAIAILTSFIADQLPTALGDYACDGTITNLETGKREYFYHCGSKHVGTETHWGYRHFLLFFMGCALALVQAIYLFSSIDEKPKA